MHSIRKQTLIKTYMATVKKIISFSQNSIFLISMESNYTYTIVCFTNYPYVHGLGEPWVKIPNLLFSFHWKLSSFLLKTQLIQIQIKCFAGHSLIPLQRLNPKQLGQVWTHHLNSYSFEFWLQLVIVFFQLTQDKN